MSGLPVTEQLTQTCYMVLLGAGMMFLIDLVNAIYRESRCTRGQYMAADFLTVLFCGAVCMNLLIRLHDGVVRNYIILGLLIGFGIYFLFLRGCCHSFHRAFAKALLRLFRKLAAGVCVPAKAFSCFICKPVYNLIIQKRHRQLEEEQITAERYEQLEE